MSTLITLDRLTLLVKYGLVDRGDGTIFDTRTKLVWQQSSSSKQYTWKDAHKYCEKLNLAGYNDWRLPTIEELKTLIEKKHKPTICPAFKCKSDWYWYWSSSSFVGGPLVAWLVGFGFGGVGVSDVDKGYQGFVRAVRTGP
jgi:hypothetical protein